MCTPDKDLRFDFPTKKKHRRSKTGGNLTDYPSLQKPKQKDVKNFYARMENDVKERSSREKDFQELYGQPLIYEPYDKKVSRKEAKKIVNRLHNVRPTSIRKNSQSRSNTSLDRDKSLNLFKSFNSLNQKSNTSRSYFGGKQRWSVNALPNVKMSYESFQTLKQPSAPKRSQKEKQNILKKLLPESSALNKKPKPLKKKTRFAVKNKHGVTEEAHKHLIRPKGYETVKYKSKKPTTFKNRRSSNPLIRHTRKFTQLYFTI